MITDECEISMLGMSSNVSTNNNTLSELPTDDDNTDPLKILKKLKSSNLNRLVIGQLNINSIRNKFEPLKLLIKGNIDIMVITESKLDSTFPSEQYAIEGYNLPYRIDKDATSGGVLIYVREGIPGRQFTNHTNENNIEGVLLEINLRKTKWLLFGGYNHNKINIDNFLCRLRPILDTHMCKFDNFLILGDFNSEMKEMRMAEFCRTYNLQNLIVETTCFKNILNPSCIDVILTNKIKSFQNSQVIETGISDYHKMTITVLRSFFQKQEPVKVNYRDYKLFDISIFHTDLKSRLEDLDENNITYAQFEYTFMEVLSTHAPMKLKYVRANNAPIYEQNFIKGYYEEITTQKHVS